MASVARDPEDPGERPPPRPPPGKPLGFTPQPMVRWLSPRFLLRAGSEVVISALFADFSDKREVEAGLPTELRPVRDDPGAPGQPTPPYTDAAYRDAEGSLWIDYAADVGEGFTPTYTVAWLLSRPSLELPGEGADTPPHHTRRGRLLILGGDQVYPSASWADYQDRFVGPYRAALPWAQPAEVPHAFAIPGNHDWYDGLTSFMRLFGQGGWIGGWKTRQRRSYVALQLSERWWLWATDIQFDTYIDGPQLDYFREAARQLGSRQRVILITAKPSWIEGGQEPQRRIKEQGSWETLSFLEEKVVAPTGARVAVTISGDKHHYARYTRERDEGASQPRERITAGGGGAHTSATHQLPERLTLNGVTGTEASYEARGISPTRSESRQMRADAIRGILGRTGNGLAAVIGVIWGLIAVAIADAIKDADPNLASGLDAGAPRLILDAVGPWSVLLLALLALALVRFADAKPSPGGLSLKAKRRVMGLLHWGAHALVAVALSLTALALWDEWVPEWADDGLALGWLAAAVLAVAGFTLGRGIFALYLRLANENDGRQHATEIFGGLASAQHKNFLRLKLDRDDRLTIYPIGVRNGPQWTLRDDGAPDEEPWFVPVQGATPLEPRLLEEPITLWPDE